MPLATPQDPDVSIDFRLQRLYALLSLAAGASVAGCGPSKLSGIADAGADDVGPTTNPDDGFDDSADQSGSDASDDWATDTSGLTTGDGDGWGDDGCAEDQEIVLPSGAPSGYAEASDGALHRCEVRSYAAGGFGNDCRGTEQIIDCMTNADCVNKDNGYCIHFPGSSDFPETACECRYPCATDVDCGSGTDAACVPPQLKDVGYMPLPTCAESFCTTDADCPSGECGLSLHNDGCGPRAILLCRSAQDSCRTDADCLEGQSCAAEWNENGPSWQCVHPNCTPGRLLVVNGEVRRARLTPGASWTDSHIETSHNTIAHSKHRSIDTPLELAANGWRLAASIEHASVASFARHTLECMALGAPPEILAAIQAAALDEIEHTKLCLTEAHRLDGRSVAPMPLPLDSLHLRTDVREFARALIEEGCLGETFGAAEAAFAGEHATDATTQLVLRRIEEDESRHAALAFQTLSWIARQLSASQRQELASFAEATVAQRGVVTTTAHDAELLRYGILGGEHLVLLRTHVAQEIALPILRQVLLRELDVAEQMSAPPHA